MAVPWLQIVQLVPSILDVSRELLRRTRTTPTATAAAAPIAPGDDSLALRVAQLEENERRQAELVAQMAEQIGMLSRAVTALHKRVFWLTVGLAATALLALVAFIIVI